MSREGIGNLKKEYEEIYMSEASVNAFRESIERGKRDNRKKASLRGLRIAGTAVAAALIAFVILPNTSAGVAHAMEKIPLLGNAVRVVTFRNYTYESDTQIANVDVPKLEIEDAATPMACTLGRTTDEINVEIDELTEKIIQEFEVNLRNEGYQEVQVFHEVVYSTEQYFTLKLTHYMGSGSGARWDYYYTIDLTTGERMTLANLFEAEADYITPISEEIKHQMQTQMEEDSNKYYWLNDEIEEWNFKEITADTQFYINENNNLVISFNEGDVAPMYMGVVTFEIPAEVLEDIRK